MRIIVDAMGGDNAPMEIVKGALNAHKNSGTETYAFAIKAWETLLRWLEAHKQEIVAYVTRVYNELK